MKKIKPNRTLDIILALIDKDVRIIQKLELVQLDHQSAATLCKYATTLSGIKTQRDKDKDKEIKELNGKPIADLIAEYSKKK